MKFVPLIIIVFVFYSLSLSQYYARISIQSESDIRDLFELGVEFEDARVRERINYSGESQLHIVYNVENDFVTVRVSDSQLQMLHDSGFKIGEIFLPEQHNVTPVMTGEQSIPFQLGWPRTVYNGMSLYETPYVFVLEVVTMLGINRHGRIHTHDYPYRTNGGGVMKNLSSLLFYLR